MIRVEDLEIIEVGPVSLKVKEEIEESKADVIMEEEVDIAFLSSKKEKEGISQELWVGPRS